jgi:hypothetical protein
VSLYHFVIVLRSSCIHPREMEKYRLIQEHKADIDDIGLSGASEGLPSPFPEVRITQQGKPRNYITYAMNLFVSTFHYAVDLKSLDCCSNLLSFLTGRGAGLKPILHYPNTLAFDRYLVIFSSHNFFILSGGWIQYHCIEGHGSRNE